MPYPAPVMIVSQYGMRAPRASVFAFVSSRRPHRPVQHGKRPLASARDSGPRAADTPPRDWPSRSRAALSQVEVELLDVGQLHLQAVGAAATAAPPPSTPRSGPARSWVYSMPTD